MTEELRIFPLHAVLFPGGVLPLRIFEARYLDMVSACLRADSTFGVCLIRSGAEVGAPAECMDTGTTARVVDWSQTGDGLLAITARGERRFRLRSRRVSDNNLVLGRVEYLDEPEPEPVPPEYRPLADMLYRIAADLGIPLASAGARKGVEAAWLGFRLAELLPMTLSERQALLEERCPRARLQRIRDLVAAAVGPGDT